VIKPNGNIVWVISLPFKKMLYRLYFIIFHQKYKLKMNKLSELVGVINVEMLILLH